MGAYCCELFVHDVPDEVLDQVTELVLEESWAAKTAEGEWLPGGAFDELDWGTGPPPGGLEKTGGGVIYVRDDSSVHDAFREALTPLLDLLSHHGVPWLIAHDAKWDLGGFWVDDEGNEGLWLQGVGKVVRDPNP